jgi:lysophospholipase L1-like esterase
MKHPASDMNAADPPAASRPERGPRALRGVPVERTVPRRTTRPRPPGPGPKSPSAGASTRGEGAGKASGGSSGVPERPRRSRFASAGRCLAVGLVCFGIWLLFDANQLYLSARASPLGTRRTVAMEVLRPLAWISNTFGLSSIVDGANDALHRNIGGLSGIGPNFNPVVPPPKPAPTPTGYGPPRVLPHNPTRTKVPMIFPSPPPRPPSVPPVAQPTAAHPLVMLDIGDSLGEDLGYGLADEFGGDPLVTVDQEAQVDTGLADPAYYDWPAGLKDYLNKYHPRVVVMMFGGNDAANFIQNNRFVGFGTALWRTDYGERVAQMMNEATDAGARVFWVGMPPMAPAGLTPAMRQIDAVDQHQAATHPGVTYFSSWKMFANSAGLYTAYVNGPNGQPILARYTDGIHFTPGGYDLLASAIVSPMQKAWHIHLLPPS